MNPSAHTQPPVPEPTPGAGALPTVHAAGFVVASRNDSGGWQLLLVRSSRDGYWGLPKGHVGEGEDGRQAARRELWEETRLADLREDERFHQCLSYLVEKGGARISKQVSFFLAFTADRRVCLSSEHVACRWESPDAARRLVSFENLRQLIGRVEERLEEIVGKEAPPA